MLPLVLAQLSGRCCAGADIQGVCHVLGLAMSPALPVDGGRCNLVGELLTRAVFEQAFLDVRAPCQRNAVLDCY